MINSIRHLRCPMCPYATCRYHDLKRHMHVHTKHTENTAIDETVCMHCNKKFSNKYNCARHMVTCADFPMIDASNVSFSASNVSLDASNVSLDASNVSFDASKLATVKSSFQCNTCYKSYSRQSLLIEHIPNCKQVADSLQCHKCKKCFAAHSCLSRHRKICKVTDSVQSVNNYNQTNIKEQVINIININSNNTNTLTNTNNINVNNFGQEDKTHIDQVFIDKCLRGILGDGVPNMVKRLHLDPNAPENHNLQIYSKKHSLMKIRENNEWNIKDRNDVLDKVIHNSLALLYNNFHNPDSDVKKEDHEQHFNMIAMRMLEISNKLPKVHFPLRRKVFALVMNFCDQLTDITKDI